MLPYFEWTTITIGPLTLQVWGMWVAIGIGVALWILTRRARFVGLSKEDMLDIAFWVLIGGFIGARLAHVFWYEPAYYLAHPTEMIAIWHGGLSSFGGVIGAVIGFFASLKKKKISFDQYLAIADELSFVGLFGWMFARTGCFCIHDHLGMPCKGQCWLGVNGPDVPRYDMALLEMLALLPLVLVFLFSQKIKQTLGGRTYLLMMYYGVIRFCLDFLRARDIASADVRYLGLTPGQYAALVMFGVGVWLWWRRKK